MPYPPFWNEEDQWLPPNQPVPMPAQSAAPPRFATPPFLPPTQAASAPRPALDAMAAGASQQPMRSDPALQSSRTRKILGGLAGAALGAGAGFVNAAGRSRVDPNAGGQLADAIVNAKFNKANRTFGEKQAQLTAQAKIEQARAEDERKMAESEARIGNYNAQKGAADARATRSAQTVTQKPIATSDGKLINPADGTVIYAPDPKTPATPQTIDQYINQEWLDPTKTIEVKNDNIQKRIAMHNQAHPEKPITKVVNDNAGNLTAVTVSPGAVAAAGGRMALGPGGKTVKPPASTNAAGPRTAAAEAKAKGANFTRTMQMANAFKSEAPVKSFEEVKQAYDAMRNAGNDGPGDMAVLRYFAKITDPSTGVREGEYADMAKAGGVKNAMDLYLSGKWATGGRLAPDTRKAFLRISDQIVKNRKQTVDTLKGVYKKRAQRFGVDPTDLFVEEGAASPDAAAAAKSLTADTAKQYLQKAGGDKAKARELAKQDGYTF